MSTMRNLKKVFQYIIDPGYRFAKDAEFGKYDRLSDEELLKRRFYVCMKKELDLENPQTFNEKLQWLKLYDRKPEYTRMVDKLAVKQYIADVIGEEYVIPTLGVWDRFEDIDFDSLPDQFVLKCTHDSGGIVICRDKAKLDISKAKKRITASLKCDFYMRGREWPYKNVPKRIIAEKYLQDTAEDALTDYKFFCFNGVAKIMYISKDHGKDPRTNFFDMDFNPLPIRAKDPPSDIIPAKPENFELMERLATCLAKDIPFVRVDFYNIDGNVYLGELTFFHMAGFAKISPEEWDYKLGSWLNLPSEKVTAE